MASDSGSLKWDILNSGIKPWDDGDERCDNEFVHESVLLSSIN